MDEMNNRELFEMPQGITSEGPYVNPIKPSMTKQEAIKKAIEVMEGEATEEYIPMKSDYVKHVSFESFPQVAKQIIEELGYD